MARLWCMVCVCVFFPLRLSLVVFLQPFCGFVLSAQKWLSILSDWDGEVMGLCLRQCSSSAERWLGHEDSKWYLFISPRRLIQQMVPIIVAFFTAFTWTEMWRRKYSQHVHMWTFPAKARGIIEHWPKFRMKWCQHKIVISSSCEKTATNSSNDNLNLSVLYSYPVGPYLAKIYIFVPQTI